MKFGKETTILACTIITVAVAVCVFAGVPASALGLGALSFGLALEWAGQRWGWWRVGLVVVAILSVGEIVKRVEWGGDTGEVFEHPYTAWASALGYESYTIHTPWGVERGYLTPEVAAEIKSKGKAQALSLELSSPGLLQQTCSSWSISATESEVAEICSELKEELRAEKEAEEVLERIEALHKAGGPID